MEIFLLINRSRFIVNVQTVANLVSVFTEILQILSTMQENMERKSLDNILFVIQALKRYLNDTDSKLGQEEDLN